MLHLEWSNDYSINCSQVDDEHKKLIEMANEVFGLIHPEANRNELIAVVKELFKYMESHFEHEEAYMEEIEFPEFDRHRKLHALIVREMNGALKGLNDLESYAEKLREMMVEWVVQHIIQEDAKIGQFVRSRNTDQAPALEESPA